jgi:hypothetical protein
MLPQQPVVHCRCSNTNAMCAQDVVTHQGSTILGPSAMTAETNDSQNKWMHTSMNKVQPTWTVATTTAVITTQAASSAHTNRFALLPETDNNNNKDDEYNEADTAGQVIQIKLALLVLYHASGIGRYWNIANCAKIST